MACQIGAAMMLQRSGLTIMDNENSEISFLTLPTSSIQNQFGEASINRQLVKAGRKSPQHSQKCSLRRSQWTAAFALNTSSGVSGDGEQEKLDNGEPNLGSTRLGRIVSAGSKRLLEKINSTRKNFPLKIFLLLLGFYTANALATILGQTGDWDVLVAGIVVAAIEAIGMLMYKKSTSATTGRWQSFVTMVNYWKAGVCLGLFVDAFKLGS